MDLKLEKMARCNKIGIIMNGVSAVLGIVVTVSLACSAAVIGNAAGGWFGGIEHIDSESYIAGYEAAARIFGGLGGMLLTAALAVGIMIIAIYPVFSIAALILGMIWNKRYIREERQGYGKGNQIAQLALNGILTAGIFMTLIDRFGVMRLMAGIYYLAVSYFHFQCLLIIKKRI